MGKTFKDRRKYEKKHEHHDGLREQRKEPKRQRYYENDLTEDFDPYEIYDDQFSDSDDLH